MMDRRRFVKSVGCAGTLAAATQLPAGASCMDEMMKLSQNRPSAAGMGYVVLDKGKTFAEQITAENTIYEIRYDFDLGGMQCKIPAYCVLKFEGGRLNNGTIICESGYIDSCSRCFDKVLVYGKWNCSSELRWWCESSKIRLKSEENSFTIEKTDCTEEFQYALDSDFDELHIDGCYYITNTVILKKYKKIVLSGLPVNYSFAFKRKESMLSSYVFSDKDISLLRIAPEAKDKYANNRISIQGGNFDTSLVPGYSSNCIEVDIRQNRKIWGLNIDCGINGYQTAYAPATGCGIKFLTDAGSGYATMVRISGNIVWFGTGIHIHDALPCWITDVEVNSCIINCATAIDSSTDIYVNASIQPYTAYTAEKKRETPLINIAGGRAVIGGMIWDLGNSVKDKNGKIYYANDIAIHIERAWKVAVTGKIKQLGYDHRSKHVTGNRNLLREHDWTMGDKYNISPNMAYNCMESFLEKGGTCNIALKNNVGDHLNGVMVKNMERIFKMDSPATTISLDSYDATDGRYIEINLTNVNAPIAYFGFTTTSKEIGFRRCVIELIYNGKIIHAGEMNALPLTYGKLTLFDTQSNIFSKISEIKIKLYEIFAPIYLHKFFGNVLVSQYQGYSPAFLPISGGTVYGPTKFKSLRFPNGESGNRPIKKEVGEVFFDVGLNKPIWWNGSSWVDATGKTV